MSWRCHRSSVSGVAIVAISRKAARPTRRARAASRRRSVGETQSAGPKLTPEEPVLFDQVRDRLPLSTVQPAGEHAQHHLKRRRIDHGAEITSQAKIKDVGRELEHYGVNGMLKVPS